MDAVFLKENILKSSQNDKTGKNALKLIKFSKQNEFLLEKNLYQFMELIDFLKAKDDVFVLTGYSLCGKSLMASVISQLTTDKTLIHYFKCTPASTIDDVLLTFFETFKNYAQKKLIHIPKIETQNFQERINIYLTKCENPIVIILDGLNEIKNKENKNEIMNFLSQAVSHENIKLVITTRAFDVSDLKNINLKLTTSIIKPLTLNDIKEYCLINIINSEGVEEFHKLSRGHYFNLSLAMSYIQPTNLTIKEFVEEIKSSSKNIDDLVISKNLSLVPQAYFQILWLACLADFGMPKSNILVLPESDEEQLLFLQKKGIIDITDNCIYVKDYFKTEILKSIEPLAQKNIIKGIIKFLEAQLPLKPSLRELKLSRLTIRNEISRLNNVINKAQQKTIDKNKSTYLSILGYSKQFKTNWDGFDDIIMPKSTEQKNIEESPKITQEPEPVPEEVVKNEDKDFNTEVTALGFARMLKSKFSYAEAVIQYADALNEAINAKDKKLTMEILKDIAECYFRLGEYPIAIENYGKAHELAKEENLLNDCYEIMLKIADIYKSMYKKDLAGEIYKDIMTMPEIDNSIKLRAELNLFELNFSKMKSDEIVRKYYELLEKAEDNKTIMAKIHFRLGFLYDRGSSFEQAIKHYKASIQSCADCALNENISSCYYNLAEIYNDKKDYDTALDYYLKSYAVDELTKNSDGLMLTAKKLARIYERKNSNKAVEYYEKAVDMAKRTNDNYPLACAILDLGDYYYRQKKDTEALKTYISAQKIMANQLTHENKIAINDRINDLKVRMGRENVEKILREFS